MLRLTNREIGTILAALRMRQGWINFKVNNINPQPGSGEQADLIATDDGLFEALSIKEIDALCEKINS